MKLVKYKDDSKIKLIKEIKTIMEGMNLVQVHLHRMCGEREGELDQLTVLKFRTGVGFGSGTVTNWWYIPMFVILAVTSIVYDSGLFRLCWCLECVCCC